MKTPPSYGGRRKEPPEARFHALRGNRSHSKRVLRLLALIGLASGHAENIHMTENYRHTKQRRANNNVPQLSWSCKLSSQRFHRPGALHRTPILASYEEPGPASRYLVWEGLVSSTCEVEHVVLVQWPLSPTSQYFCTLDPIRHQTLTAHAK